MNPDITLPKEKKVKVYAIKIGQAGTDAPTVTTLQNTTNETIVWTRSTAGQYVGTGYVFTLERTLCLISQSYNGMILCGIDAEGRIIINTLNSSSLAFQDGLLVNTSLLIQEYNL